MSFRTSRSLAAVVVFSALFTTLSSTAAFAQRVSFPNFAGPGAGTVRNQLVGAVCDTADCVAATRTTTGGKPDWKKAKKEAVPFFVTGTVLKKGKALSLDLQVLNKAGPPVKRKTFALDKNGTLPAKGLQQAIELMKSAFGAGPATTTPTENTPTEPEKTTPPPKDDPPPKKTDKVEKTPERTEKVEKVEKRADPEPEPTGAPSKKPSKKKFLVVDVGVDIITRRMAYANVATPNLRRYDLPPIGQPVLGLKFYPLALARQDLLAGLGLDVGFAFAPWIQSRLISAGDPYPTSTIRFDAGVRFDIVPIASFPLAITPYVGVRYHSFSVGAKSDGTRIDGLPNVAYVGLRAGLGVEVPIIPDRLSVFGKFGIIPVFGSGEIISSAFFPNGSTFGLEANGGLGVQILPFLGIRASFEFINYGLTFKTGAGDTYVASGATDTWIGGNASLRLSF
ncbi:MAG: hypothetical protein U0228_24890 [Myxococcaceae bacterium]